MGWGGEEGKITVKRNLNIRPHPSTSSMSLSLYTSLSLRPSVCLTVYLYVCLTVIRIIKAQTCYLPSTRLSSTLFLHLCSHLAWSGQQGSQQAASCTDPQQKI